MRYALAVVAFASVVVSGKQATSDVAISGELRQWHQVTLTLDGPQADELSNAPNPFLDYRMTVTFAHESGTPTYRVPGYFAADGVAANSSATSGNKWRAHLAPDKTGRWTYRISFVSGNGVALSSTSTGRALAPSLKNLMVLAPALLASLRYLSPVYWSPCGAYQYSSPKRLSSSVTPRR